MPFEVRFGGGKQRRRWDVKRVDLPLYLCDAPPTPWEGDVIFVSSFPYDVRVSGNLGGQSHLTHSPQRRPVGISTVLTEETCVNVQVSNGYDKRKHRQRDEACELRNLGSETSLLSPMNEEITALSFVPPCCVDRFRPPLSRSHWLPYSPWGLPPTPLVSLAVFHLSICTVMDRRWLRPNIPLVSSIFVRLLPGVLPLQSPSWSLIKITAPTALLSLLSLCPLILHGPRRYENLSARIHPVVKQDFRMKPCHLRELPLDRYSSNSLLL